MLSSSICRDLRLIQLGLMHIDILDFFFFLPRTPFSKGSSAKIFYILNMCQNEAQIYMHMFRGNISLILGF